MLAMPRKQGQPVEPTPMPEIAIDYKSLPNRFLHLSKAQSRLGLTGLENIGNTCFINAGLQCISNAVPLTDYFLSGVFRDQLNCHSPYGCQGRLAKAYAGLLKLMWKHDYQFVVPVRLLELIFYFGEQFSDGRQHDAQEFLAFFLDKLHEDLNRSHPNAISETTRSSGQTPPVTQAVAAWRAYLHKNSSVIVDLFQGQLQSVLKCLHCGFSSSTFDVFMYLSLPLPNSDNLTLECCLEEFLKEETLDSDDLWVCPACKEHKPTGKKIDIWMLPPLLIIHLKRFRFVAGSGKKVKTKVQFPVSNLDLRRFVVGPVKDTPVYNLFAKIDHSGSLSFGHYSAVVKHYKTQQWYRFNDKKVATVEEGGLQSKDSYLLFYCRVSTAEYRRQEVSLPELWPLSASENPTIDDVLL